MDAIHGVVRVKTTSVFFSFRMNDVRFFVFVFVVYTCVVFYRNRPFLISVHTLLLLADGKCSNRFPLPLHRPSNYEKREKRTVFKVFRVGNLIHSPCAAAEVA